MSASTKRSAHRPAKLTRMNLLVNRDDLWQLTELYGLKSASEAVRRACALVLLADDAERLAERTVARRGLSDIWLRAREPLPHEWPEDEPIQDLDWEEEAEAATSTTRRR